MLRLIGDMGGGGGDGVPDSSAHQPAMHSYGYVTHCAMAPGWLCHLQPQTKMSSPGVGGGGLSEETGH